MRQDTAPAKTKVVVFAAHALPHVGGVELYNDGLLRRLAQRGWSVQLVTSDVGGGPGEEVRDGIRIVRLPSLPFMAGRLPVPLPGLRLAGAMRALRREGPAAVVTNTRFQPFTWLGTAYANHVRVPRLHVEHGSGHVPMSGPVGSWVSRTLDRTAGRCWVIRTAASSVGVSQACAAFLRAFGAPAPGVLHSGVDSVERSETARRPWRERLNVGHDEVAILYVGRVTDDKGVPMLLEAFGRLPPPTRAHLVIAGGGNALERLKSDARSLRNVHLLGSLPPSEVPGLLAASDIFAHPSMCAEGLPRSVLEAAAAGLPIVATPQGGTLEVIRSEAEGILVAPGDAAALTSALAALIANPARRSALGEAARRSVADRFDSDRVASQAEALVLGLGAT